MKAFCTIISPDFLPFARCLFASIRRFDASIQLHVLITGDPMSPPDVEGMHFHALKQIESGDLDQLVKKYEGSNDQLRWALKPAFLLHLLRKEEKLIYVDADIHFFSGYNFLFDSLEGHSFLLTPHFASPDPFRNEEKFMMNFLNGLYNAGFVGVTKKAVATLNWWMKACLYNTADDVAKGFFVDQRYLDMVPVIDEGAFIVRHQGCNIGSWNIESFERIVQADGTVLINGLFPVVFIHFNHETTRHIVNGNDPALRPYYDQYTTSFLDSGYRLEDFIKGLDEWKKDGIFLTIKRKLSVRTRIKRSLFKLAKKL